MTLQEFTFGRPFDKVFITSDLHLSHHNIIKYAERPFENTFEMNEYYLKEFDKLPQGSVIWNLGDFSFDRSPLFLKQTLKRLNSNNKINCLLMGNHDKIKKEYYLEAGFSKVIESPFGAGGFPIIFSHSPIFLGKGERLINIHGHTHQNNVHPNTFCSPYYDGIGKGEKVDSRLYINASVDKQMFLNFQDIIENSNV